MNVAPEINSSFLETSIAHKCPVDTVAYLCNQAKWHFLNWTSPCVTLTLLVRTALSCWPSFWAQHFRLLWKCSSVCLCNCVAPPPALPVLCTKWELTEQLPLPLFLTPQSWPSALPAPQRPVAVTNQPQMRVARWMLMGVVFVLTEPARQLGAPQEAEAGGLAVLMSHCSH